MPNGDPLFTQGEFQGRVLAELREIKEGMGHKVDRSEFAPVRAIVYGLAAIIFGAVGTALVAKVVVAKVLPILASS